MPQMVLPESKRGRVNQVIVFLFICFDSGREALDPPTPLARNETLFCFWFRVLGFDPGSGQPHPPSLPRGGGWALVHITMYMSESNLVRKATFRSRPKQQGKKTETSVT